ncbi:hypothetical protein [Aeromicrobium sp. UC242_57]|uniref:hypothetical protein n=1 Tax=Aeromicrobium sp. UC242_57 TaxID=3374624 RepID=UPI00378B7659
MLVSSRPSSLRAIFTALVVVVALLGITAPAQAAGTATWTGTDSELWSDPDNWGGVAPTAGSDLVFPAGASRTATVNDLAPGTSFGSITIAGAGYDISGTSLALTGALSATYTSGTSVVDIDTQLGSATVTVAAGSTLSLNGTVSSSSGCHWPAAECSRSTAHSRDPSASPAAPWPARAR